MASLDSRGRVTGSRRSETPSRTRVGSIGEQQPRRNTMAVADRIPPEERGSGLLSVDHRQTIVTANPPMTTRKPLRATSDIPGQERRVRSDPEVGDLLDIEHRQSSQTAGYV